MRKGFLRARWIGFKIDQFAIRAGFEPQPIALDAPLDHRGVADQDRKRELFVAYDLRCAQHAFILAFGVDDAAPRAPFRY